MSDTQGREKPDDMDSNADTGYETSSAHVISASTKVRHTLVILYYWLSAIHSKFSMNVLRIIIIFAIIIIIYYL
jgi:Na+/H+ antiporter NhaD/arsenite permease-like protein